MNNESNIPTGWDVPAPHGTLLALYSEALEADMEADYDFDRGYILGMREQGAQPAPVSPLTNESNMFISGYLAGWDAAENSPVVFVKAEV